VVIGRGVSRPTAQLDGRVAPLHVAALAAAVTPAEPEAGVPLLAVGLLAQLPPAVRGAQPRGVAVQVEFVKANIEKPRDHFIASRFETRRCHKLWVN
jgi:hypothetical protein